MIVPVRCFSCGKPVGHLFEEYQKQIKKGKNSKKVLDELGLVRFCCRGVIISHVEAIDTIVKYS